MIAQLALCGIALAAPRLDARLVQRTRAALAVLTDARGGVDGVAGLKRAERAMRRVRQGIDAYFHAPNLLKARPVALKMRAVMRALRGGERPLVRIVDDVMRFDPALHDRLGAACERLKRTRCARAHRLEALVGEPTAARAAAARPYIPASARVRFDARFKAAEGAASPPE